MTLEVEAPAILSGDRTWWLGYVYCWIVAGAIIAWAHVRFWGTVAAAAAWTLVDGRDRVVSLSDDTIEVEVAG